MAANLVLEIAAVVLAAGIIGVWRHQASIDRRLTEMALAAQRREDAIAAIYREKDLILKASEQTHDALQAETEQIRDDFAACREQCRTRSLQYARDSETIRALADRLTRLEQAVDEIRRLLLEIKRGVA